MVVLDVKESSLGGFGEGVGLEPQQGGRAVEVAVELQPTVSALPPPTQPPPNCTLGPILGCFFCSTSSRKKRVRSSSTAKGPARSIQQNTQANQPEQRGRTREAEALHVQGQPLAQGLGEEADVHPFGHDHVL